MEYVLIVSYEDSTDGDFPCLTVCRKTSGNQIFSITSFWGTEAEQLYRKLTRQEDRTNAVAIGTVTKENHWLRDLLSKPAKECGYSPFIITPDMVGDISQVTAQNGRAGMLHNKECPHGHKCQALDCIECMEIYEKEESR